MLGLYFTDWDVVSAGDIFQLPQDYNEYDTMEVDGVQYAVGDTARQDHSGKSDINNKTVIYRKIFCLRKTSPF